MLRGLVLVALIVNVALFAWLRLDNGVGQGEREPQRLSRQVSPQAIVVLPDVPDLPSSAAAALPSASPASGAEALRASER